MINLNNEPSNVIAGLIRMGDGSNQPLRQFIKDEIDRTKDKLVKANDMVIVHRLQGRVQAYEDLFSAIEDAVKIANVNGSIP